MLQNHECRARSLKMYYQDNVLTFLLFAPNLLKFSNLWKGFKNSTTNILVPLTSAHQPLRFHHTHFAFPFTPSPPWGEERHALTWSFPSNRTEPPIAPLFKPKTWGSSSVLHPTRPIFQQAFSFSSETHPEFNNFTPAPHLKSYSKPTPCRLAPAAASWVSSSLCAGGSPWASSPEQQAGTSPKCCQGGDPRHCFM